MELIFGWLSNLFLESIGWLISSVTTLWLRKGTIDIDGSAGAGALGWVQSNVWWVSALFAILSLMFQAIRLMIEADPAVLRAMGKYILQLAVVTTASVFAINIMIELSDAATVALMSQFKLDVNALIGATSVISFGVTLIMGLLCLLAQLFQVIILIARDATLILLTGALPIAASSAGFKTGSEALQKMWMWILALTLFKPTAAFIYGVAFALMTADDLEALTGLVLLTLAVAALPMLMKLLTPIADRLGSASGARMAGAAVGIVAVVGLAMATGGAGAAAAGGGAAGGAAGGGAAGGAAGGGAAGGAAGGGAGEAAERPPIKDTQPLEPETAASNSAESTGGDGAPKEGPSSIETHNSGSAERGPVEEPDHASPPPTSGNSSAGRNASLPPVIRPSESDSDDE